jgi:hypothetical protein
MTVTAVAFGDDEGPITGLLAFLLRQSAVSWLSVLWYSHHKLAFLFLSLRFSFDFVSVLAKG